MKPSLFPLKPFHNDLSYPHRDYIEDMIVKFYRSMEKGHNPVGTLSTRAGKGGILSQFAKWAYEYNWPICILVHKDILLKQMSDELLMHGIPHGIIKAGHYESRDTVQIASRDTMINRVRKRKYSPDAFKAIFLDETHTLRCTTNLEILAYFSSAFIMGVTATLSRLSGEGFDNEFDDLIVGPSKRELISRGIIVPTLTALPEKTLLQGLKTNGGEFTAKSSEDILTQRFIHGDYVQHYFQFAAGKSGLAFCPTVNFAHTVADNFNSAGIPTIALSSRNSSSEIDQGLKEYADGKYKLISSCNLFIEGLHVPKGEVSIQLRPTMSTVVYFQSLGRCIMPAPGKEAHINIDCVNNIYNHTFPDLEPEWKLEGESKEERKKRIEETQEKLCRCDSCRWPYDISDATGFNPSSKYFLANPSEKPRWANKPDAIFCPHCGAPRETKGRVLRTIDGTLQLISLDDYLKYEAEQKWAIEEKWLEEQRIAEQKRIKKKRIKEARTLDQMLVLEKEYGHEKGWAAKQLHFRRYSYAKHSAPSF